MSGGSYNYIASQLTRDPIGESQVEMLDQIVKDVVADGFEEKDVAVFKSLADKARQLLELQVQFDEEVQLHYNLLRSWEWYQSQDSSRADVQLELKKLCK